MCGLAQLDHPRPSSWHSNVAPASADSKATLAERWSEVGGASVMFTPGGVASTPHTIRAGVVSALPARSVASTSNVCLPSTSPAIS